MEGKRRVEQLSQITLPLRNVYLLDNVTIPHGRFRNIAVTLDENYSDLEQKESYIRLIRSKNSNPDAWFSPYPTFLSPGGKQFNIEVINLSENDLTLTKNAFLGCCFPHHTQEYEPAPVNLNNLVSRKEFKEALKIANIGHDLTSDQHNTVDNLLWVYRGAFSWKN